MRIDIDRTVLTMRTPISLRPAANKLVVAGFLVLLFMLLYATAPRFGWSGGWQRSSRNADTTQARALS